MNPPQQPRPRSSRPATADELLLRGPDALLAAIPYLLGFWPRESAVLVWLTGGRIQLTQRMDLPDDVDSADPWLDALWRHTTAGQADELVVIMVTARDDSRALASLIGQRAESTDVAVRDSIRLVGERWWSYLCEDEDCCGPDGRLIDPSTRLSVAAELTASGLAPLPSRDEVAGQMAGDPRRQASVQAVLEPMAVPDHGSPRRVVQRWRRAGLAAVQAHLAGSTVPPRPPLTDEMAAVVLAALADIRVRDTVLWELSHAGPPALASALDGLVDAVRCAPAGHVAPVASCCAVVAWLLGDGVRAVTATERALDDDPGYTLAILVDQSLRVGLPPTAWREAMLGLTREECWRGSAPAARQRRTAS